jgi:hypothetical protein
MLTLSTGGAVLVGVVMALWLMAAAWAVITGLRLRNRATFADSQADRLAALLDTAPALPVAVKPDGRVEAPDRLGQWLGLPKTPGFIVDFSGKAGGLTAADCAALAADVTGAQRTGAKFARSVKTMGSDRTLLMKGGPAPLSLGPPGSVMFWVFDATESQAEIGRLSVEVDRTTRACGRCAAG